ncbi:Uncharacterised protein [Bordetella ansorpii]|uniref:Uncharacterized protein n=1 Tax=Bordetella ansorpii TaxID=288768 RepID=A0A157RM97_9BORD|nr:hypothetical protein [Bordetella ansorpii]SAI59014.1 Uncharacterised protein [Bordetella ansorpii]
MTTGEAYAYAGRVKAELEGQCGGASREVLLQALLKRTQSDEKFLEACLIMSYAEIDKQQRAERH